ncbi:MAG: 30S ribosomal protein S4 [Candidatus Omnitrophica bacterium]|nr:30S ribosomal protein S4 [Candidatus Omnitrophota bacterium]
MARELSGNKCRICRREGQKLFLKGQKCATEKCPFARRPTPPGMRGKKRPPKPSYYALQLREKQKTKRMYGMQEKQFRRFYDLATKSRGITGRMLLQLLERRLDNVIYRALFAFSRNQARQYVLHGYVAIHGRKVNIPSYIVREGEEIQIKQNDKFKKMVKENMEANAKDRSVPDWLTVDKSALAVKIVRMPTKEEIGIPVNEQFIVELYSK